MRVLVTGGTGFLGSAVVRAFVRANHHVRVLVRPDSPLVNISRLGIELVPGDVRNPHACHSAMRGCDALVHCATDYRLWTRDPRALYATNVEGTRNVMRAALDSGISRVVHTSSVATLGPRQTGEADEESLIDFSDLIGPYKQSKFIAEHLVLEMVARYRLPAVIVNPSTPLGPRDTRPTPTGRIVVEAAAGRIPAFVDTGLNIVHVDDVAHGHLLALLKGRVGERYILGGDNMPLSSVLAEIAGLFGRSPPKLRLPIAAVLPVAMIAEIVGRMTGREPFAAIDAVRMARKKMFYTSDKARTELGYSARSAVAAIRDAVADFAERKLCPQIPSAARRTELQAR
jgi:dihydroflavonol-4-reductase